MNHILFIISFILMFSGVGVFGYMENTVALSASIIAGAIGMAFANIDKIEHFKGAGFEAHMKKAVEEAYATTKSLREFGVRVKTLIRAWSFYSDPKRLGIKTKDSNLLSSQESPIQLS
ncbi:MAG: hypothetical protein DIZ78_06495 [endosymbiont of Escarpia spicata]|uniref:Uncharacterized protein n=1 Tax=endosymbiont of Escarpia spicata TaxID=2200908 RepID=A0A370DNR2_9GAMM|nr:MAG: hypothetical protein DIZ78_06495 [endosymbiont of Escarpia spicata]